MSEESNFINVAVCTPSYGFMRSRYTASLIRMFFHYQQNPILGQENKNRFISYFLIEGSMVGAARESFVEDVLKMPQITHLLFIDEDMGFRENTLNILLSRQVPFVSCNYRMKIPPCNFTARTSNDKEWMVTDETKHSLEEAFSHGFGFSLIAREVLEATKGPRFSNKWSKKYKTYTTEDRSFCIKAREAGFTPYIDHKASREVYHIGSWAYSYDDNFPAYKRQPIAERMRSKTKE